MTKRKPRVGRPPRAGKLAGSRFELRLTAGELTGWTAAAERQGLSLSAFVREAVELAIARGSSR